MFNTNVECFQVSTVNGTRLMTLMSHEAVMLDPDYTIRSSIDLEPLGVLNTHELNFVNDGTRVLFMHNIFKGASREESAKFDYDGRMLSSLGRIYRERRHSRRLASGL